MSLVDINWKPNPKELRSFSRVLAGALLVLAIIVAVRGHAWSGAGPGAWRVPAILAGVAFVLAVIGALAPRALRPVYLVWMGAAYPLGLVMTNLVLTLLFYAVLTPVGLVMRLAGRDAMGLRRREADTYWVAREAAPAKKRYLRQY